MSTIPTYQKINAFMESAKPSVYTKSNTEGLDRVRKEDGMYAYFMEAASIEYNVERFCDIRQLGGLLDSKGYGIALPKGINYRCSSLPQSQLPTPFLLIWLDLHSQNVLSLWSDFVAHWPTMNTSNLKVYYKFCICYSDSPYTAAISAGVLSLQERGVLKELKIKWWEKERGGGSCQVKTYFFHLQSTLPFCVLEWFSY